MIKSVEFNNGDKVVVIKDGKLQKAVFRNLYPIVPPVAVVEYEDGSVEKVPYDNIAKEPITETPDPQNEPIKKKEITITSNEFIEIAASVMADELRDDPFLGLLVTTVVSKIHKALFTESQE